MASTSACSSGASTGRLSPLPEACHEASNRLQHGRAGRSPDARVFDTGPTGEINHDLRLGEFLTEWNNGQGRSPVEALAMGQRQQIELAERAGIYDDED